LLDALADAGAWIPAYRNRIDDETTDDSTDDE